MIGKIENNELDINAILPQMEDPKKRNSATILCDVIKASYNGARKTHIMYRSNLNPTILEKYLKFCLEHGLIEKEGIGYRATRKGAELVRHIEEINSLKKNIETITRQAHRLIDTKNMNLK
ncbi:hypothetical protein B9Q09_01830 [Candidatus Marsarchaeota G2 archaeon ECH_B_SAG-C16]|uniref:ArnR1-like winged helix-turn-helix domain-containing protein n=1 Tax=Candidatus Marsarchaeota G2 archaeon ECH_B_SAG-C16 TaxID=1978163 RepID=A0A2R6BE93_9ARCH|nr:MAG: hypothetical protein B9Q09_01830 [Candidatus Marsarchaeota G2 archaeon ECH_B_SAG-C16]